MSATPLPRTFVCPECGYDGFRMGNPTGTTTDFSFQPGCPACATLQGKTVWLVETSDPRTTG